jgi:hypothetical protein
MFFRKLTFLAGLFLAFCLFAPSAHAQYSDIQDAGSDPCFSVDYSFYACGGGGGWEPTPDGGPNPPTMVTCSANAALGQQCRTCSAPDTSPNSPPSCGWTKSSGACTCTPASGGCTTQGACRYYS